MYVIRKLNTFNLWMVVDPQGNHQYMRTWQRCMEYVNTQISHSFFYETGEVVTRHIDE